MKKTTRSICLSGIIAALYSGITLLFGSMAFGPIQIRPGEALTILPLLLPESIWGLFIGCIITNIISPMGIPDLIFGSLATLIASYCTSKIKNPFLAGIPPVLINAIVVPLIMYFAGGNFAYFINFLTIGATQIIFVYGLGIPLYYSLKKIKIGKFNDNFRQD